ncbi:unnamed protein product [marine sediment metagenome]|uniref:Uncharacterized protein n=1 Tax=marine sediment metagenome TaxID=412755 RepID=X1UBK8_9ZZZZ
MSLGIPKAYAVNVGTKGDELEHILAVFDPITDNFPHTDTVVDPRLSKVAFHLGLEPEWVKDSHATFKSVILTTPIATMKQARIHTVPIPRFLGDTLRGNAKDKPIRTLIRFSSKSLYFESKFKSSPTSPILPTARTHDTPTAKEIVTSAFQVR